MTKPDDIIKAKVVTAAELSPLQFSALEELLKRKLNKQVEITSETDASLIGGLYIYVDGLVIDHTVKKQIGDLKESIKRGLI